MIRTILLYSFFFTLIPMNAFSFDWIVTIKVDPITEEKVKTAITCNKEGHCLSVYRRGSDLWLNFSLNDKGPDILSPERLPIYRVDKNKPIDLDERRRTKEYIESESGKWLRKTLLKQTLYYSEPKWINFFLEGLNIFENKPPTGPAKELMKGTEIVFRYFLFTGGHKDTEFSLRGSKKTISEAMVDPK